MDFASHNPEFVSTLTTLFENPVKTQFVFYNSLRKGYLVPSFVCGFAGTIMANQEGGDLASQLVDSIREISGLQECRNAAKKMYGNLMRRVKLLSPLFEELKDSEQKLDEVDLKGLQALRVALNSALELLKSVNDGSKIFQALQIEKTRGKFHTVTTQIEEALSQIHYERLNLSEEVHEQTELVHVQFKRAKGRMDSPDWQLQRDLALVNNGDEPDLETIRRLSEKLHLATVNDLQRESTAIHDMMVSADGYPQEFIDTISFLLKEIKGCVMLGNPEVDVGEGEKSVMRHRSPIIPDDFRCPISLELMKDPVIVSTGQTYERSSIQKWLDAGHKTCPKTQQTLLHTALTPNYVLKSLIALWCDSNGVELPKSNNKRGSECDRTVIGSLLQKLVIGDSDEQRSAAGELRLLAKRNADNRVCIAEAGAIPLLVELLSSRDSRTQEHAVTALLNLSINEANKGIIVSVGAIPEIVDVLKTGSTEARENAAATLFSLSVVDENKVAIGAAGAIPPLIDLLQGGTPRGKKDAATAIFNLCIYQGNKVRAVRAGIVPPLMILLKDASGGMMDEALAILAILASHHEGKMAIAEAEPMEVLVEVIRSGSARNRENGSAVLWSLCAGDVSLLKIVKELGGEEVLKELCENGTERAKRKAGSVLELLQRIEPAETGAS